MRRYGLRDDQWDRVKDFLPAREGHVGGTAQDNRLFVEAVLYRYRAGIPRRDLPPRFGDWKIVWQRFDRWAKSGVFDRIFKTLASDHDNEYMWLDATIVRAHQHSAGAQKSGENQAIGRSRGGLTTKIHAVVDALGNPLGFSLTPPSLRSWPSWAAARPSQPTSPSCGRGLRRRRPHPDPQGPPNHPGHPTQGQPPHPAPDRFRTLPRAQSRRAVVQQTQTLPRHRHTL